MLGKILDFICTRLRSTEIALDSRLRANKIPYFTKHCRITYKYHGSKSMPLKNGKYKYRLNQNGNMMSC